jgi:hypothetical protein
VGEVGTVLIGLAVTFVSIWPILTVVELISVSTCDLAHTPEFLSSLILPPANHRARQTGFDTAATGEHAADPACLFGRSWRPDF